MTPTPLYPLRLEPIFQYRLWGGRRLGAWMDSPLPDGPIGEAWVLSDRPDHASRVADGPLQGTTLTQLMASFKAELLGETADRFDRFPLLLKVLDVQQMLSVQVHPSDDMVSLLPAGETGKTEAWVVLEADPQSRIYVGLKPQTTAQDLRTLTANTADDHLASFKPEIGQGVVNEAGIVHSLGDGVMVFEVQENSDVTFRLYDWDHIDAKTGKPRALQVDKALACINFDQGAIHPVTPAEEPAGSERRQRYFDNAHFRLWRIEAAAPFAVGAAGQARALVCIEGAGHVEHAGTGYAMTRGAVILLPASLGVLRFTPAGSVVLLEIAAPEPS